MDLDEAQLHRQVEAVREIGAVTAILDVICRATGMGFAAVARVTDDRWIACQVRDGIGLGLEPGDELEIQTTLCREVRNAREAIVIDDVQSSPVYGAHPVPARYGFRSYLSMPIVLRDGTFFGTLCALDPNPARLENPETVGMFKLFAELIAFHLEVSERLATSRVEKESAEEQLRQSQKMEAVGQLTGGLAHDFNNLLTGITGSLELLQRRIDQGRFAECARYVRAAEGAAKRAAAITHRLLAFSRRQSLDPKPCDVNRLIAGFHELLQRTVGPAVTVDVVGANGLWPAIVDANQLENVLLNLCINARDAMPDGGRLTLETANVWVDERGGREHDLPPGQYIKLCVTDTGTGMSPDVVKRAFDPFFTTKPTGSGTGLGLSMVYGFVRQSGGQIRIDSEPGYGTTMALYLPRCRLDAGDVDEGEMVVAAAPSAGVGTVLIVDDEPTVRMLVREVLEELGYEALEAGDGAAGLAILQSRSRIDLLITDVGLPGGINGRQVADAGRELRPELKVLFVTGYAETAVVGNGHLDDGMAILTKPFSLQALGDRITALVAPTT